MNKKLVVAGSFVVLLVIASLLAVFFIPFVQQSIFEETLFTEDFKQERPALLQQAKFCSTNEVQKVVSRTCEDQYWKAYKEFNIHPTLSNIDSDFTIEEGGLLLRSRGRQDYAIFKKDLRSKDIELRFSTQIQTQGRVWISIQDKEVFSYTHTSLLPRGEEIKDWFIEMILDFENENLYHIKVNGKEARTVEIDNSKPVLLKFSTLAAQEAPSYLATLLLETIKLEPYYSCEIQNDEVIVSDRFNSGTTFTLNDLTFINSPSIKFCKDSLPPLKRDLRKQGLKPDIQGSLLTQLTRGNSITVKENEVIDIRYIVDFKEGIKEKCDLDSAYIPKLGKCEKFVFEEEDIDVFYNVHDLIEVGEQSVIFEGSVDVFGKAVSVSSPEYLCQDEKRKASVGQPRDDCWKGSLTYGSFSQSVFYNEEVQINDYMKVKYLPNGFFNGEEYKELKPIAILSITNNDLIKVRSIPQEENTVGLNSKKEVKFKLENSLGNIENSGVQIRKIKKIINIDEEKEQKVIPFSSGLNDYSIEADTSQIGEFIYVLQFYYVIGGKKFLDDETIAVSYKVEAKPEEGKTKIITDPGKIDVPIEPKPLFRRAKIAIIIAIITVILISAALIKSKVLKRR